MAAVTGRVKLIDGIQMVGEAGSGHTVVMDGPPESGGRNMGVRPMELLILGMGGCSAIDVLHILRKGRHQVTDCEVSLAGTRAETDPKVFEEITVHYTVTGKGLSEKAVDRAIRLSKEVYCSASIMLGKSAEIKTTFEVIDEA